MDLQIQHNSYQNFHCFFIFIFFSKTWQAHPEIHLEVQGIQKSQNNLEKQQNWRLTLPNFRFYHTDTYISDTDRRPHASVVT